MSLHPSAAMVRVLSIAGSDPSGGAGIQADIKTITVLGGYAMSAITAITVQNSLGVTAIEVLAPQLVAAQIAACVGDIGVDAVKIGMLGSGAVAAAVADAVRGLGVPVVFDPVMFASAGASRGASLADDGAVAGFEALMRLATLTTPNVAELAALGGHEGMAARGIAYLAKGGDAGTERIEDLLIVPGDSERRFAAARIDTRHTHGTGCTLSSAIAVFLARGAALPEAVDRARGVVRSALRAAPGYGAGAGPMGHAAARG